MTQYDKSREEDKPFQTKSLKYDGLGPARIVKLRETQNKPEP